MNVLSIALYIFLSVASVTTLFAWVSEHIEGLGAGLLLFSLAFMNFAKGWRTFFPKKNTNIKNDDETT